MISGIYQIKNQVNGNRYIGSAVNLKQRWAVHLSTLRHNTHNNLHLQAAFNKYGESAFAFSVLESVGDTLQLIPREQHYLDTLLPEYNISQVAGSPLGYQHTKEARRKMSEMQRGRTRSEETCRKISEVHRGKHVSAETRHKISMALKGRVLSDEHCRKMSEAMSGKRHPMYGKHHSEETRKKMSEAKKGERHPNYGKHHSAETKRKMSEAKTEYWRQLRAGRPQLEG